ncbi:unnamed protein product, partial [Brachionus calyciflorus]
PSLKVISELNDDELLSDEILANTPSYNADRLFINRTKKKILPDFPPNPQNLGEIAFPEFLKENQEKKEYRITSHLRTTVLSETTCEKDLGVIITNDLKWNKQFVSASAKANRALGKIKCSFTYLSKETIIPLYTALVRPYLEYASYKACEDKPYEQRLKELGMNSFEDRRTRDDLIQMFKIAKGFKTVKLVNGVNYAKSLNLNLRRPNNLRLVK